MGAGQGFETDMVPKLENAREVLQECAKKLVPAMEQSVDLAKRNGIGGLQKSAEASVEGVQTFVKSINETIEIVDNLIDYIKKVENAVGGGC